MQKKFDALLFDLGRVVIELDSARVHARWAELSGVALDHIDARVAAGVIGSEPFRGHERGEISDAAFFAHLRAQVGLGLTDAQILDGWNAIFVGEMPGIRAALARAGTQLPLYAFTNTNRAHQAFWSARFADVLAPFRKIYASNEIGARKPDAEAFRLVAADMGVAPHRVLFFDDSAENIAGARACGLVAVQVTTAADVERTLNRIDETQAAG